MLFSYHIKSDDMRMCVCLVILVDSLLELFQLDYALNINEIAFVVLIKIRNAPCD